MFQSQVKEAQRVGGLKRKLGGRELLKTKYKIREAREAVGKLRSPLGDQEGREV